MGSIREIKGKFACEIRRKNTEIYKTFHTRNSAELWIAYKEQLIDEIETFQVPYKSMITIADILELKEKELIEKGAKEISDIANIRCDFSMILDSFVVDVSYEKYIELSNEMLKKIVLRGGNKKSNTGNKGVQSPVTVLRKFRLLASAYSYAISKGFDIENHPTKIIKILKELIS